jgi:hypothetical protein
MECSDGPRYRPSFAPIDNGAEDYAPLEEAEWRDDAPAWPVATFFEIWKEEFRQLNFIPISDKEVKDTYSCYSAEQAPTLPAIRSVYRPHGWPDITTYRKDDCLAAVQKLLEEQFPDF